MNAVIADYGTGNLHSLIKALGAAGAHVAVEEDARRFLRGDVLVLPGVGAFPSAAARLGAARTWLREALWAGHPCLGICLGMQLLFERSEEGPGEGLAVFAGDVRRLTSHTVPHMGWNSVDDVSDSLIAGAFLKTAYFANSFTCHPTLPEAVVAWSTHETERLPAAVRSGRTLGVQFHPEKSSRPGLELIAAFLREAVA